MLLPMGHAMRLLYMGLGSSRGSACSTFAGGQCCLHETLPADDHPLVFSCAMLTVHLSTYRSSMLTATASSRWRAWGVCEPLGF